MNEPDSSGRRVPRWTVGFLRALARTGSARAAAKDAGIDHTTAYGRRRSHPGFAAEWTAALAAHAAGVQPAAVPDPAVLRAEATARVARVAREKARSDGDEPADPPTQRWSAAREARFFDELAATANVKRAAAAAGLSTTAIYARRMREAAFRARWSAVLETARAAIEMKLIEAASRAFDPDAIGTADVEPRVGVADAIRILQLQRTGAETAAAAVEPYDAEAVRRRIETKLAILGERETRRLLGEGWSLDEEHRQPVPPGWVRG